MTAIGKTCLSIFFNFDTLSSINNDGDNTGYPHGNTVKEKNAHSSNDDINTKGFPRAVTAVTAVTTPNTSKVIDYNSVTNLPDNLYRLYERGDKWGCNNCTDKGDKWHMLTHNCKMNKKC